MPRVSVLTPIYNTNPQYLRECIESILNQTYTDFEFLILNDSPNNTEIESIVKEYAKHDKRIKYYKNDKNIGISESRNKLLDLAHGEYIAIFDHDDISVPNRLEKEVNFLDENKYIGVVSGLIKNFGALNNIRSSCETDTDIKIAMTDNCAIWHTAAMIRKSVLIDNNIHYESYFSPAEDYRLWTRLMDVTHFYIIQEVLVMYRIFAGQTSERQKQKMDIMHDAIKLDICNKYPLFYKAFLEKSPHTKFRLNLFGFIPLLKIKQNWILLFGFIPVLKIKWK